MVVKSSTKRTSCSKHTNGSSQKEKKIIYISFIKNLVYLNYFYIQINYVYWLIHVIQRKNLKRLNTIICNLNENERESFRKMLQKNDLLGGSKGNDVHEVFFHFLLKNEFLNINRQHVLNTQCHVVFMLCMELQ